MKQLQEYPWKDVAARYPIGTRVHAREPFRQHSYFSDLAVGVISGLGPLGYELALEAAIRAVQGK